MHTLLLTYKKINKILPIQGISVVPIINPLNQTNKFKTNINNTQYIKQKSNPNNKYNENYMSKMHIRCKDIVKKFYKSQSRGKTHDNYKKMIKFPEGNKIKHRVVRSLSQVKPHH